MTTITLHGRTFVLTPDEVRLGRDALAACDGDVAAAVRMLRDYTPVTLASALAMVRAAQGTP